MFARPAAGQMESLMQMNLRSFFPSRRAGLLAGLAIAAVMVSAPSLRAQVTGSTTTTTDAQGQKQETVTATATLSDKKSKKQKVDKADRIQQSKDTKVAEKKEKKLDPLLTKDLQLPDKQLYDKAVAQAKSGHFDIARLDLQTLLNTYPDSQYQMRAKLAVADSWYQEGGTAALAQAEQEYSDFITFFPNVPEAAEAQMRIGDIYFKQMDVPDRDYTKGTHAEEAYRTMLKQYPDAPKEITAQAKQKLREVQELMATREAELGAFYATHNNWPASIARYQTVVDTYPQYSHMDDTLIGIGQNRTRTSRLPTEAHGALLHGRRTRQAAGRVRRQSSRRVSQGCSRALRGSPRRGRQGAPRRDESAHTPAHAGAGRSQRSP
jgi:outer membrane protein assembly factor BamD